MLRKWTAFIRKQKFSHLASKTKINIKGCTSFSGQCSLDYCHPLLLAKQNGLPLSLRKRNFQCNFKVKGRMYRISNPAFPKHKKPLCIISLALLDILFSKSIFEFDLDYFANSYVKECTYNDKKKCVVRVK